MIVDLPRGTQPRLDRALDPRVRERGVLAGEMDASLGRDDVLVEQALLRRLEQRERAAGIRVLVPHPRRANLEAVDDLRVDLRDVLERLRDALVGRQRAPALRVLGPGVAR